MAHKIAVVGDKDSVLPFKILGFDVFPAHEAIASEIAETIRRYDAVVSPAIILIPNHKGSLSIGKSRIQENVEKAVGQNIL